MERISLQTKMERILIICNNQYFVNISLSLLKINKLYNVI